LFRRAAFGAAADGLCKAAAGTALTEKDI